MRSSQYSGVTSVGRMALVVRGVVDQDGDRPEGVAHARDRGAQRRDVGEIRVLEVYARAAAAQFVGEGADWASLMSMKAIFAFCCDEAAHDRLADARAAAGDEHGLARKVAVGRRHDVLPIRGFRVGSSSPWRLGAQGSAEGVGAGCLSRGAR